MLKQVLDQMFKQNPSTHQAESETETDPCRHLKTNRPVSDARVRDGLALT